MLLMIDNYDSFTYNLVQYFGELNTPVQVYRNDQITCKDIQTSAPKHLVISPGPCTPKEAGISVTAIQTFAGQIPLLGVCLGHQSIGQAFGGKIVHARQIMHGKTSWIHHTGDGIYTNIPNPFQATRYHSLVIDQNTLPDCLEINAWTLTSEGEQEEIMGIQHKTLPIVGVQYHPESILTQQGHALLKNFLTII